MLKFETRKIEDLDSIIKEQGDKISSLTSSANAWKMLDDFIKSDANPTLRIYKEVMQECFNDGCHSAAVIHMRYIERLGELIEDLDEYY